MRKIAIFVCVVLLSLNIKGMAITAPPKILAAGGVLMDLNSGEIILEKNSHNKYAPASTTKILTALLTLENCKLTDKVIIGKNPPFEDGSKIYLLEGEEVTVEQLLYALLLESANDSALALAEHISGSKEAFAQLMNKRAKELGCTDTNFTNPNGLYDKNHYTSASDLAKITEKAMENPVFRKIVSTVSFDLLPTNKQPKTRYFHNHNKLLSVKKDKYSGADGVKTGYTVKAKHTYVGSATRNGRTLIATFLFDNATYYQETAALFNYGFNNFVDEKIFSKGSEIASFKLKGDSKAIPATIDKDLYITVPKGSMTTTSAAIVMNTTLTSVKKGEVVGTIKLSYDNTKQVSVNLISTRDQDLPKALFPSVNKSVKSIFKLSNIKYIFLLGFLIFLSRGFYRKYKRRRNMQNL
jgi:serine-type D-Ala-D-Ala carboxypeptidase (penicillin-binding protein 5/6)